LKTDASEKQTVWIGRVAVWISFAIALVIAPQLRQLEQAYQFIQEYSNYLTPGAFALFSLGLFWKRTTSTAAIVGAVLSIPMVLVFKNLHKVIGGNPIPFLNVTMWVYLVLVGIMVAISLADRRSKDNPKGLVLDNADFKVSNQFAVISILIMGILVALYTVFY
jgi:solute:Na+ symporter, SSS family